MTKKHLDLRLIIELYYGEYPLTANNPKLKTRIEAEDGNSFCSIYFRNDLPDDFHNRTHQYLIHQLGELQKARKINPNSFWPFYTHKNNTNLIVPPMQNPTPERLKNSTMRAGGLFFTAEIARYVANEFEKIGYEIIKKYNI